MARHQGLKNPPSATGEQVAEEGAAAPSAEERKGMRAHDDSGNVRPADGRWDLHKPEQESQYVRTETP